MAHRWLLWGADVVTGDGRTILPGAAVLVEDGHIAAVDAPAEAPRQFDGRVLNLTGCFLLPGLINHHTHGVTLGPRFASGAPPLDEATVRAQLDAHLAAGHTTILNLDGFALPEEVKAAASGHPVRLRTATAHTPQHFRAADAADGRGLTGRHRQFSVAAAVAAGAVAIGEVGSGHTLGGGGQEYMYLPAAVARATGRTITPLQARRLKEAVLGRRLDRDQPDLQLVARVLSDLGLQGSLTESQAVQLVRRTVMPAVEPALAAFREAARLAVELQVPMIVHTSAVSRRVLEELCRDRRWGIPAGLRLIAGHANHDSFTVEEAVEFAAWLRREGAVVDASTFDAFGARRTTAGPDHLLAMLREGVVDTLSTDYGGGAWDPLLSAAAEALRRKVTDVATLVAMMTSRVAAALPHLAPGRGTVRRGEPADLVWVDREDVARVHGVMMGGRLVPSDTLARARPGPPQSSNS